MDETVAEFKMPGDLNSAFYWWNVLRPTYTNESGDRND